MTGTGPALVIKSVRDIPSWFDLKKYDGLAALDLPGWGRQITIRAFVHWMLAHYLPQHERELEEPTQQKILAEQRQNAESWVREFTENPIVPVYNDDGHLSIWHTRGESKPYDAYTVWAMTAAHAYYIGTDIHHADRGQAWIDLREAMLASDVGKSSPEQNELIDQPIDLIYRQQGIDGDGLCNVMVDLAATDEQIMADFRHWLTHFRKVAGIKAPAQNLTEKDFRIWIEARVLPYIDLYLWSLAHRRQITQNVMGQALFPDEYDADTTERIRRTTRPKAERMLREEFAHAVERQVQAYLIARGKPALKSAQLMPVPE